MYFLGSIQKLVIAKIFRSLFKGKSKSFVMELPHYEVPSLKTVAKIMLQGAVFLKKEVLSFYSYQCSFGFYPFLKPHKT